MTARTKLKIYLTLTQISDFDSLQLRLQSQLYMQGTAVFPYGSVWHNARGFVIWACWIFYKLLFHASPATVSTVQWPVMCMHVSH